MSAGVVIPSAANAVAVRGARPMFAASVKKVTILAAVKGILFVYLFDFLCFGMKDLWTNRVNASIK
jgi:hypothetical protein